MPMYNYHCEGCIFDFEYFQLMEDRHTANCPSCETLCEQGISTPPAYHAFPEGVFEHIAAEPIYVNDKNQLKDECKRHGVHAPGLLD